MKLAVLLTILFALPASLLATDSVILKNVVVGEYSGVKEKEIRTVLLQDAALKKYLVAKGKAQHYLDVSIATFLFDDMGQSDYIEIKVLVYTFPNPKLNEIVLNRDATLKGKKCQRIKKIVLTISGHEPKDNILKSLKFCVKTALKKEEEANKKDSSNPDSAVAKPE